MSLFAFWHDMQKQQLATDPRHFEPRHELWPFLPKRLFGTGLGLKPNLLHSPPLELSRRLRGAPGAELGERHLAVQGVALHVSHGGCHITMYFSYGPWTQKLKA